MRKKFREFYNNDTIDFENLNEDVLVVFDTNTLLNIYRYSSETSDTFIKSINKVKNNVWIPYQVGMEFNLNRKKVMGDVKKAPDNFKKDFEDKISTLIKGVKNDLGNYFLKSIDAKGIKEDILEELTTEITNTKNKITDGRFEELANLVDTDEDRLMELIESLDDKVGDSFSQHEIKEICQEGERRYKNDIPPGYRDKKKTEVTCFNGLEFESKYGDLILWKQIIEKAKDDSINTVVLITDDNKPDWWYPVEGKNVGPRAELKNELVREANADLIMINSNSFLKQSNSEEVKDDLVDIDVFSEIDLGSEIIYYDSDDSPSRYNKRLVKSKTSLNQIDLFANSETIRGIKDMQEEINYFAKKIAYDLEETNTDYYFELEAIYSKLNAINEQISYNFFSLTVEELNILRGNSENLIKEYLYIKSR